MAADPYSRLIAFLKVALPLVALAILSTVFLVSSRIEPGETIPFAEGEVAERIRGQQVTGPFFSGVTTDGDRISFAADEIVTDNATNKVLNPVAQLDLANGGTLRLEARRGDVDVGEDVAIMSGEVVIESTNGYVMRSDRITSRLSFLDVEAPGEVTADGPAGTLRSGSMLIGDRENRGRVQLLFTDGVKLIYDPKETE